MTTKERRVCTVCDDACTAPAGVGISGVGWADGDGWARGTCVHCGEPVCSQCSRRVRRIGTRWFRQPRRVCNICIEGER